MPDVTRRRLLSAGLGLTLAPVAGLGAACEPTNPSNAAPNKPAPRPQPAPDLGFLDELVAAKTELIAAYDRTSTAHPAIADPLTEYRARHQAHLSVLTELQRSAAKGPLPTALLPTPLPEPEPTASDATPTQPADPTPDGPDPDVPDTPADALAGLVDAETAAAEDRQRGVETARSPDLARLVASIGACERAHAILLSRIDGSR